MLGHALQRVDWVDAAVAQALDTLTYCEHHMEGTLANAHAQTPRGEAGPAGHVQHWSQ